MAETRKLVSLRGLSSRQKGVSNIDRVSRDDADAKSALAEARRLNPQLTIKWFAEYTRAEPIIIDGLRKAGLPEG